MKTITYKGKVGNIEKMPSTLVRITMALSGNVNDVAPTAKETTLDGVIVLKSMVANHLKIGSTLKVEVTIEDPEE